MKIVVSQLNPIIGDLTGNALHIIAAIEKARQQGAHLILFSELVLCGYPPEDFLLLPHFMKTVEEKLAKIVQATQGICAIVGLPRLNPNRLEKTLYNSAAVIHNQKIVGFQDKILLPTYDVFDERRYFEPGEKTSLWKIGNQRVAITICEDLWQHSGMIQSTIYRRDPILELQNQKPTLLLNLSASPYSLFKFHNRLRVCSRVSKTLQCPVILCNQVGGNDQLIFDGYSLYVNADGLLKCAKGFEEDHLLIDLEHPDQPSSFERNVLQDLYHALVVGVRDYFHKSGFKTACLGLSGGIDSALVACIAAEALGPQNILGVLMPSRYSTSHSREDAEKLADKLGIMHKEISIEPPFESYLSILGPHFNGKPADITEENLQARIRGMLLMALSNKFGYIVLSTSNKSEIAMGYSTLYGDTCGGLAVIGDLTKDLVYDLAHWINRHKEIIPWNTIRKAPSAELRPNQKDSDTLPDYAILDQVLREYIEDHRSPEEIASRHNYPLTLVEDLVRRIHSNEYKRRQLPPSLRVSEKAFSIGRRFPIVQRWV
jgi:NAD+ synthase (glutamine-hydrolysing)